LIKSSLREWPELEVAVSFLLILLRFPFPYYGKSAPATHQQHTSSAPATHQQRTNNTPVAHH
jgi:hypothetical protein